MSMTANGTPSTPPNHPQPGIYEQVQHDLGIDPQVIAARPRWSVEEAKQRLQPSVLKAVQAKAPKGRTRKVAAVRVAE